MVILVDSREQKPLEFDHPYITDIIATKLDIGDYAVRFKDGYIPPFYFERKTLGDLFSSLTNDYERFKKEIQRATESNYILIIVVEGSFKRILSGYAHSTVEGLTILRKLITLLIRYRVWHHFFNTREDMAHYIAEFYVGVGKEYVRRKKQLK